MTVAEQSAGAEDFAQRVGRMLFPAASGASGASGASASAPRARSLTFLALPSARSTRYLIPARPGSAAAAMIGRQIIGSRPRTRVVRRVAMTAMRSGLGGRLWPARVTVTAGPESVLGWLSERLGPEVSICIGIGRPRANRKPVLQVTDAAGRLLGYAKVGHNELTRTLVRDEGIALDRLGAAGLTIVVAPRLIAQAPWQDLELLLMSPLRLPAATSAGVVDRGLLERAVSEIAAIGGVEHRPWDRHPLRSRVVAALDELGDRANGLRPALDLLDAQNPTLAFGSWHGDLNPGNLAALGDRLAVWDWERFESGVPLGFDLLHHDFQRDVTVRSRPPVEAAQDLIRTASVVLRPIDIDEADAPSVAVCYLLWLGIRFVRDRQSEAGAALGAVDEWLAPVLRQTLVQMRGR